MTLEVILKAVCAVMGVAPEEVLVGRKTKGAKQEQIIRSRQYGMYLSRELVRSKRTTKAGWKSEIQITYPEIATFYYRNHATAIHACRLVASEIAMFKTPATDIRDILRLLDKVRENGSGEIDDYIKNRSGDRCRGEINSLLKCLHK
jgi:chromosomal replication initiation ATPase DnaA